MNVRISLKGKDQRTVRIGLARQADGRLSIYRDGKRSTKTPSLNPTQIGLLIGKWIRVQSG